MRRIGRIDKHVRLFRLENGAEKELSRHAVVHPGNTIQTRSDIVSYGHLGWNLETLDGQEVVHDQRLFLDISVGTSRERTDLFGDSTNMLIASKSLEDRSRHRSQVASERRRGVKANWKGIQFDCIIGSQLDQRNYQDDGGGYDQNLNAVFVSNIRQFVVDGKLNLPNVKDRLTVGDRKYIIVEIQKDVAVIRVTCAYDRGSVSNK